jgi:hypothetical protein
VKYFLLLPFPDEVGDVLGSGWKAPLLSQACCQRLSVPAGS